MSLVQAVQLSKDWATGPIRGEGTIYLHGWIRLIWRLKRKETRGKGLCKCSPVPRDRLLRSAVLGAQHILHEQGDTNHTDHHQDVQ